MSWLRSGWKGVAALEKDILGGDEPEKKSEAKDEPVPQGPRASMEKIREHLRRLGATLAAGATVLLTGLGWVQIHNVFPAPVQHGWLVPAIALAGSLAALAGVGWLVQMIFSAQRRIPISSDVGTVGDLGLKGEELNIRNNVFRSAASAQGDETGSLRQLELDARKAERDAEDAATPAERDKLKAKAARLDAAVDNAAAGAALLILERRSAKVFRGARTKLAFLLAAAGIVLAFGVADYSKGQRDLIALRKSCAEAVATGALDACGSVSDTRTGAVGSGANAAPPGVPTVAISVRRPRTSCVVTIRVDGKVTRATKAGSNNVTIADFSQKCGVRLEGGGLGFGSPGRHTGRGATTLQLKPRSYSVLLLEVPPGSTPTDRPIELAPLVAAP